MPSDVAQSSSRNQENYGYGMVEEMDPVLWAEFQFELLVLVLARLPLYAFFKFRAVCKAWNNLANDPRFRTLCKPTRCEPPLLITSKSSVEVDTDTSRGYLCYNVGTSTWLDPFGPLVSSICCRTTHILLGSAGGLVLTKTGQIDVVEEQLIDNRKLCVRNPLTQSERELPSLSSLAGVRNLCATIAVDRCTSRYKILVISATNYSNEVDNRLSISEVYDSKKEAWESKGLVPMRHHDVFDTALFKGKLYCLLRVWFKTCGDFDFRKVELYRIGKQRFQKKVLTSGEEVTTESSWSEMKIDLVAEGRCDSACMYEANSHLMLALTLVSRSKIFISELDVVSKNVCKVQKVQAVDFYQPLEFITVRIWGYQELLFEIVVEGAFLEEEEGDDSIRLLMSKITCAKSKSRVIHCYKEYENLSLCLVYEPRLDVAV